MTNPTDREEGAATSGLPEDLIAVLEDRSVMIPRDLEVFSKMIYRPEDLLPATTASTMSELGDKERSFVEDQRRIAGQPTTGTAAADVEYVYEPTVTVRSQSIKNFVEEIDRKDALLAEKDAKIQRLQQSNLRYIDRTVHCRDLLTEAAEVLRAIPKVQYEPDDWWAVAAEGIVEELADWYEDRAKPLLDKLEER